MNYIYTASKLATSTCERKLARITPPRLIPAVFIANPFTIWTTDDTDGAICIGEHTEYTPTSYVTIHRSPNNRASRKAVLRAKADIITSLVEIV